MMDRCLSQQGCSCGLRNNFPDHRASIIHQQQELVPTNAHLRAKVIKRHFSSNSVIRWGNAVANHGQNISQIRNLDVASPIDINLLNASRRCCTN